jgi:hypothetical protein
MSNASRAIAIVVLVSSACSTPDRNATVDPVVLDKAQFEPVVPMLNRTCSSLDCHGSPFRNLRLYGYGGVRLAPGDNPEFPRTTPAEIASNYDAVVGLEPEALRAFVAGGRKDPTMLAIVRKGRETESHKGGARLRAGDPADRCLVSWLAGAVDAAACASAAEEKNPLEQ